MNTLPSLFVSHGSPMIALQPGDAGRFLSRLGRVIDARFGRPRAVVAVSAHTLARQPVLLAAPRHEAVHDFGGFPKALFDLRYDAPGAPALARDLAHRLNDARIDVEVTDAGGLDHGIWTALRYLWPAADVPVLPLAFVPTATPAEQFQLGQVLAPLGDDGVLVLGTGSITHNLSRVFRRTGIAPVDEPEAADSAAFRHWFADRSAASDWTALLDYRRAAPHAAQMHPTDEHLLPWFVAAGAGGREHPPQRLHDSVTYGCLGMDVYGFGEAAAPLADTLASPVVHKGGPED